MWRSPYTAKSGMRYIGGGGLPGTEGHGHGGTSMAEGWKRSSLDTSGFCDRFYLSLRGKVESRITPRRKV